MRSQMAAAELLSLLGGCAGKGFAASGRSNPPGSWPGQGFATFPPRTHIPRSRRCTAGRRAPPATGGRCPYPRSGLPPGPGPGRCGCGPRGSGAAPAGSGPAARPPGRRCGPGSGTPGPRLETGIAGNRRHRPIRHSRGKGTGPQWWISFCIRGSAAAGFPDGL